MVAAGSLDRIVIFLKRAPVPTSIGAQRGGFEPDGASVWGNFEPKNSVRIAIGDFRTSVPAGVLTVRDGLPSSAVRAQRQVRIDGVDFIVRAAGLPDKRSGTIAFDVIGAEGLDVYADYVDREGEVVVVRRAGTPPSEANARARVTGYSPKELAAGMRQGDRRVLLLASDIEAASWPGPLVQTDRIIVRGQSLAIRALDDSTHRFGGTLYAYEIVAGG